jgi:hypothetical protein
MSIRLGWDGPPDTNTLAYLAIQKLQKLTLNRLAEGDTFFLCNLRMDQISLRVCPLQAFANLPNVCS